MTTKKATHKKTITEMVKGVLIHNQPLLPDEAKALILFTIANTVDVLTNNEWKEVVNTILSKYDKIVTIEAAKAHLAFCKAQV